MAVSEITAVKSRPNLPDAGAERIPGEAPDAPPAGAVRHAASSTARPPQPFGVSPEWPVPPSEAAAPHQAGAADPPFPAEFASLAAGQPEVPFAPLQPEREAAPAPPRVEVTIGRIEVRAERPAGPEPAAALAPPRPAAPSLDDYLARRRAEK